MKSANDHFSAEDESRFPAADAPLPSDLIIIGGGILGLATAFEVLGRGLSVTLLDEDPKRSAAWASAGMLSPYAEFAAAGALQDMMRAARTSYPAFVARVEEQSGMRVELAFPGTIFPLPRAEEGGATPEEWLEHFREMGATCRHLPPAEAAEVEPQLRTHEEGAILLDDEGYVNPRSLLTALRAAFDHLGGHWIRLPALGLAARQGRMAGVETSAGVVQGSAVVNAAGAGADLFLLPEDQERYRVRPVRGQVVRLRPRDRREGIRRVLHQPGIGYLVPRADGSVIAGATSEEVGPFPGNTAGGLLSVLEGARRMVPASEHWAFLGAWSGLRPLAGEGELFLEPDSSRKGLFHGLGLYRHGILLAPMAATRMARLVVDYLGHAGR